MQVTIVVDTNKGDVQVTESALFDELGDDDDTSAQLEVVLNAAVGKVRRAYHLDHEIENASGDEDIVAAFKAAWHAADQRGEKGRRTEAGVAAVTPLIAQRLGVLAGGVS